MKYKKIILRLVLVIILMFSFSFLLSPLYDLFCDVTGLNGKVSQSEDVEDYEIEDRQVTVRFVSINSHDIPWDFRPNIEEVVVSIGERKEVTYYAKNLTNKDMTIQAIPSISPGAASKHLNKVQCFCFDSQSLGPEEDANLGLLFYFDKDLPEYIDTVTMSYTLFDITEKIGENSEQ